MATPTVLLSFDIEEFDMPLEYGKSIPLERQLEISLSGTETILKLLEKHNAKATFFSTVVFASGTGDLISRLVAAGHELSSHGYFHSQFEEEHLAASRVALETISKTTVKGFRMPRMMPVSDDALQRAGYAYNSSLNPVFIPGRYNHMDKPRTLFQAGGMLQLPASATPLLRIPLFWLSFHNFPLSFYKQCCVRTMAKDGYLNIYFHPWEFTNLDDPALGMPWFVRKNSGAAMSDRFESLLAWMNKKGVAFSVISKFLGTTSLRT